MRYTDGYDEDEDFDEDFEDAEAEMMADALVQSNINREEEIRIANKNFKADLIDKAVFICKDSIFWRILPHDIKMKRIADTYEIIEKLAGD